MFELMSAEINQAHRERDLAAKLDQRRLLRAAAETTRTESKRPAATPIPRRAPARLTTTDR